MTGASILVRGLAITASRVTILGPLDLELEPGEYRCVLGHSGSGKTTLLRAIAGLATPTRGTVALDGREASRAGRVLVRPERRGVGMVFQGGALWPHMSVGKTLRFVLAHAGTPRSERAKRTAELLDLVRLAGYEERMPGYLSGGEAQRLALARALASSPRVLLLDEPLGPLDAELRGELADMLRELHGRLRFTALHVTHDPGEPARLGVASAHLANGRWKAGSA